MPHDRTDVTWPLCKIGLNFICVCVCEYVYTHVNICIHSRHGICVSSEDRIPKLALFYFQKDSVKPSRSLLYCAWWSPFVVMCKTEPPESGEWSHQGFIRLVFSGQQLCKFYVVVTTYDQYYDNALNILQIKKSLSHFAKWSKNCLMNKSSKEIKELFLRPEHKSSYVTPECGK